MLRRQSPIFPLVLYIYSTPRCSTTWCHTHVAREVRRKNDRKISRPNFLSTICGALQTSTQPVVRIQGRLKSFAGNLPPSTLHTFHSKVLDDVASHTQT